MPTCAVKGCGINASQRKELKIQLFQFPKDEQMCFKWMEACNKIIYNFRTARICSRHFAVSSYKQRYQNAVGDYRQGRVRVLTNDAVPTENLDYEQLIRDKMLRKKQKKSDDLIDFCVENKDSEEMSELDETDQVKNNENDETASVEMDELYETIDCESDSIPESDLDKNTDQSTECNAENMDEDEETVIIYTPSDLNIKVVKKKPAVIRRQQEIIKNLHIMLKEKNRENNLLKKKIKSLEDILGDFYAEKENRRQ